MHFSQAQEVTHDIQSAKRSSAKDPGRIEEKQSVDSESLRIRL